MKKLLSLIVLSCAMAMAFGAYAPRAGASVLTTGVATLSNEQTSAVQKAYYRCWWRYGYRHCGYSHHRWRHGYYWRHRYGYYGWHRRHYDYYGWRERAWRYRAWREETDAPTDDQSGYQKWRDRFYAEHGYYPYTYRRHYYYNSYSTYTPYRRRYAPADGYCIGLCWW